jgi:hypothetical protein
MLQRQDPQASSTVGIFIYVLYSSSANQFKDLYTVDSGCSPISTSEEPYSGMQAATHDYLASKKFTDLGEYYVAPHAATDNSNWSTSADPGGYGQNSPNTYGQSQAGGHYPHASSIYSASTYSVSPAISNAHLSYPGSQEQDYLNASTSAFSGLSLTDPKPNDSHPKVIHREPGSQDYESLDPS